MTTPANASPPLEAGVIRRNRSAQKRRTRRAVIEAAIELIAEGVVPTVAQAAERARVSRATAYRYFPTQGSLMVQASTPIEDLQRVLEESQDQDVVERVELLVRAIAEWGYDNRPVLVELTQAMSEIADTDLGADRPRNRQYWIDEALAPIRETLGEASYARLVAALSLYVGPEPILIMQTVSKLPRDEAVDILVSSARTLVRAHLE